jgi:hypothetical protein
MTFDNDKSFDDAYLDVLQNLEAAIVSVYHNNPDLLDRQVDRALELLIRYYRARQIGKTIRLPRMTDEVQSVYDQVKAISAWRLGQDPEEGDVPFEGLPPLDGGTSLSLEEIEACLERLRKSIDRWTGVGGRQGYLHFIEPFVSGDAAADT